MAIREDLNTEQITLTERAATEVKGLLAEQGKPEAALRVWVAGGGCSGLQYGMVFDEIRPGDHQEEFHGARVLVDEFSATYLKGAVVDFSDALSGGGRRPARCELVLAGTAATPACSSRPTSWAARAPPCCHRDP